MQENRIKIARIRIADILYTNRRKMECKKTHHHHHHHHHHRYHRHHRNHPASKRNMKTERENKGIYIRVNSFVLIFTAAANKINLVFAHFANGFLYVCVFRKRALADCKRCGAGLNVGITYGQRQGSKEIQLRITFK